MKFALFVELDELFIFQDRPVLGVWILKSVVKVWWRRSEWSDRSSKGGFERFGCEAGIMKGSEE